MVMLVAMVSENSNRRAWPKVKNRSREVAAAAAAAIGPEALTDADLEVVLQSSLLSSALAELQWDRGPEVDVATVVALAVRAACGAAEAHPYE